VSPSTFRWANRSKKSGSFVRDKISSSAVGSGLCATTVRAQTSAPVRIGFLITGTVAENVGIVAFRQGMSELGYTEGKSYVIEPRTAEGRIERLPRLAKELVVSRVDIIVGGATPVGQAAQRATDKIPIARCGHGRARGRRPRRQPGAARRKSYGNDLSRARFGPEALRFLEAAFARRFADRHSIASDRLQRADHGRHAERNHECRREPRHAAAVRAGAQPR